MTHDLFNGNINDIRYDTTTNYLMSEISSTYKYRLYAITVTFTSRGTSTDEARWLNYYKSRVLMKFRRRLASGKRAQQQVQLIDDLTQYEYDISSKFSLKQKNRYVHHVHGFLPIPVDLAHRVINEDGSIQDRIIKDIESMTEVTSVCIKPVFTGGAAYWLSYMTKGKHKSQFSWNK